MERSAARSDMAPTIKVAVVIPYFQRRPGILARALRSVAAQETDARLDVIVVDDGSPVPADGEVAQLPAHERLNIRVLRQPNGGPAAARNRALDHVTPDTEYVAFLDSDDAWEPAHLANALRALGAGHDFYFADFYQLGQATSAFERAGRIHPARHALLPGERELHAYQGDMQAQVLGGNVIGTPTVVYRFRSFRTLRFRPEFVYAGEDYLFWLDLARLTDRIVFSSAREVVCMDGVNVFSGSGWGTEASLLRLHHEMKYRKAVARLYPLTERQAQDNRATVRALRRSFVADVLHRLVHRKPFAGVVARQLRVDPLGILGFVPLAAGLVLRRRRAA
ncbi:succinoglycan biosynthesis protein ExoW [Pseudoduganella lurida]|uniref:Succinoglycan biosynthesis protein ExoW n=1 Tax=Pseudoduganella lurida TaxID=1036180 RepID=A0A562R1N8_9BURK|nr:glycosyltransferase family 2 protein [Pseudoduganella lurida]TWI62992.1 succinoglycan biosynthesis protein ExoW [Pseudoduganella lurida]